MAVDTTTVAKIASLARIRVEEERRQALAGELSGILDWIEQLSAVDTQGVVPMTSAVEHALHWREDKVTDGNIVEDILANAPASEFGFFAVPRVIDQHE